MARLLLFGGKGDSKTTTSAATAIHLADCGLRSFRLNDPAHST